MKKLFIIISLITTTIIIAQAPKKFYTRFGGNGYDVGYDVKQTLDSGYIITGSTSSFNGGNTNTDMYLAKLDKFGFIMFEKTFGNYNNDIGKAVVQLPDSGYCMVGYTNSIGFGGYDIFLVRTDKTGALIWQKTFGGGDWDFAHSLQATTDGGFIIGGSTYSNSRGGSDGYVIKTDGNGIMQWSKKYGGSNDDEFKSVIQTTNGGYALCGYTKSYNDVAFGDAWVFRLNGVGDSTHSATYGGAYEDGFNNVVQLPNTNLYFTGINYSQKNGVNSINWQAASNYTSNVLYFNNYIGVQDDEHFNYSAVGLNGDVITVGYHKQTGFSEGTLHLHHPNLNYYIISAFGISTDNEFFSVTQTKDKGYAILGTCSGPNTILNDFFFLKVDSTLNKGINITTIKETIKETINVSVYPNPASHFINVTIDGIENAKEVYATIVDIKGDIVLSEKVTNESSTINIEPITNGIYTFFLKQNNTIVYVSKLAVVK